MVQARRFLRLTLRPAMGRSQRDQYYRSVFSSQL
jgi:hypothetical protein